LLQDIKNTIKQSAIYGLSRVALRGASLILIPIYTAKFASDSIANINLLESFWQYLFTICLFGAETAITSFCAYENNISVKKKLIFNFFSILIVNSLILLFIGNLFSEQISLYILKEHGLSRVIFYCFLISVFESLLVIPLTIARLNNKPFLYSIMAISSLIINMFLQIYFILYLKLNFEYVFLAKFIAPAFIFIICIPYISKNIQVNIDLDSLKKIILFSYPLMIAMLLSLLLNSIDRFILADFVTKEQVAIYTIGYSIGSITNAFILAPYTLAINVIFWKKINDANFRRFMTKSSTYLFFTMIFSALIISLYIPYVIKIFVRNEHLWPSVNIIPIILFANCFVALFLFPTLDFYYKKKTNSILLIIILSLVFNLVFNIIFIRFFGIYASAAVTVLSYLFMMLIGWYFARKFSFTEFETGKIVMLSVLYIAITAFSSYLNIQNIYMDVFIKFVLIFLFLFLLYLFRFFEPLEIERIKGFLNKYLRPIK